MLAARFRPRGFRHVPQERHAKDYATPRACERGYSAVLYSLLARPSRARRRLTLVEVASGPVLRRHLFPFRLDLRAHGHGGRTARMKPAPARDLGGCSNVVLQDDFLAHDIGMIGKGRGEQRLGVGMQRMVEELLRF